MDTYDRLIIESLSAVWRNQRIPQREMFAQYTFDYVRSILLTRYYRRRFAFADRFEDVAEQVANTVAAELLREEPVPEGGTRYPALLNGPLQLQETKGRSSASAIPPSYRSLLRRLAYQGLVHAWMKEHPEEARLLRALKRHAHKHPFIHLRRDSRGQWLAGPESDFGRPPIPPDLLQRILPRQARARAILTALEPHLRPGAEHGGTCYLMDVVREAVRQSRDRLANEPDGSGAIPSRFDPGVTADGIPWSILFTGAEQDLEKIARAIVREDQEKELRRNLGTSRARVEPRDDTESRTGVQMRTRVERSRVANPDGETPEAVVDTWVQVCVEMTLRSYDLGKPEWKGISQRELLLTLLGSEYERNPDFHRERVDYLVRRVRRRWPRTR